MISIYATSVITNMIMRKEVSSFFYFFIEFIVFIKFELLYFLIYYFFKAKPAVLKSTKNKVSLNAGELQESAANEIIKSPLNDSSAMNVLPLEKLPDNSKSKLAGKIKYMLLYSYEFFNL